MFRVAKSYKVSNYTKLFKFHYWSRISKTMTSETRDASIKPVRKSVTQWEGG